MSDTANLTPDTTEKGVDVKDVAVDSSTQVQDTRKILEGVKQLCNTTLYVLHHAYYRGEDAHLVLQAKEFIKEIRTDVERKGKDLGEGKPVNVG